MRLCRAPECENIATNGRTVCTKHRHRLRKNGTFEIPERIKKVEFLTNGTVKICKIHGELKFKDVYTAHSKYKNKKYKYYLCRECISLKRQRLYEANKEKYQKYALMMREKHYEKCIERDRKYKREQLLSIVDYESLYKNQNGLCAICGNPEKAKSYKYRSKNTEKSTIKRLAVDHCHLSGKIRGLLCSRCNTTLGAMNDSIDLFESAINYLKVNR